MALFRGRGLDEICRAGVLAPLRDEFSSTHQDQNLNSILSLPAMFHRVLRPTKLHRRECIGVRSRCGFPERGITSFSVSRCRYHHGQFRSTIRKMSGPGKRTYLREVNPYLVCLLCRGYLIDATTVVECLHSFCRSCILKHLSTEAQCPSCKHVLNKAKPNIKADKALQEIVYKLVPGLYHKEMRKRREFYKKHPEHADFATPEQRGEDVSGRLIFAPEDAVSLSLEYLPPGADPLTILLSTNDDATNVNGLNNQNNNNNNNNNASNNNSSNHNVNITSNRRYLQCPALVTIAHLKKFLALKYSVDMTRYTIEICHRRAPLPEHWTLMDVAYIYAWKRNAPMRFFYRVALEEQRLEAPPHDRPSTPGLGASLPPADATVAVQNRINAENAQDDTERKPDIEQTKNRDEKHPLATRNEVSTEKSRVPVEQKVPAEKSRVPAEQKVPVEKSRVPVEQKVPAEKSRVPVEQKVPAEKSRVPVEQKIPAEKLRVPVEQKVPAEKSRVPAEQKIPAEKSRVPLEQKVPSEKSRVPLEQKVPAEKLRVPVEQKVPAEKSRVPVEQKVPAEKSRVPDEQKVSADSKKVEVKAEQPLSGAAVSMTVTTTTVSSPTTNTTNTTVTNTSPSSSTSLNTEGTKLIKTPIKILKNPDGRYEVLRSPSINWGTKEQHTETKSSSPEFSVVSIGNGQNSNGVKITLKQCTPSNTSSKKPKVISNVLLHCGQPDKDSASPSALVIQQIQRDREKQQAAEKQEKQRRRVTFVERPAANEKPANNVVKTATKKPVEQQDKKQFLQGFQLTARETGSESLVDSKAPETSTSGSPAEAQTKGNNAVKKEEENVKIEAPTEGQNKNFVENAGGVNTSGNVASKRPATVAGISGNARVNANKQCSDVDAQPFGYAKNSSAATVNAGAGSNPAMVDVYTFSNDPPIVPAGAVKRKCPPGLPIFDIKRKKQQQVQTTPKKHAPIAPAPTPLPTTVPNILKSPRKIAVEHPSPAKRPANMIVEPAPTRSPAQSPKTQTNPMLSNDTRNILDGCGLNIPASLSITLTAPKSPSSSGGFVEPNDLKDNRKTSLAKVSPSITLNDRSVDPRVLKALKAGQIRMPAPPKPRQTKQPDREINQPRQTSSGKRKREQESRDILDLSGGKKIDMHPLRIPQPVSKLKAKSSVRDNMPNLSDQGQVVTLMGGHRYYRAPPGSLTPAAHRVNDCPVPTPTRTPVYAPGLSSPISGSRSNTNLSSVFPSLQSLYALSQAPNLQQFQMDARLRLPRPSEANSTAINTDNRSANSSIPGKSHLAAQCAPVKPARSSIAPLAVPISKQQQSNERSAAVACLNRAIANEINKNVAFRSNESVETADSEHRQQLSVQTKYPSTTEGSNRYSPRSTTNNSGANEEKATVEITRESNAESNNDTKKEDNAARQTPHREAASPRVSSTASPSPPPGDSNVSTNNENIAARNDNVTTGSNGIDNDLPAPSPKKNATPAAEVSSSKSPASPDSSSVTIESSPSSKSCSTVEQGLPSPSDGTKSSSAKPDNPVEDATIDAEKKPAFKQLDAKQLTSEMFQKRLLAAFPSNEWANNPIAAEHFGNFLKSLNAFKSEAKLEGIAAEKIEAQLACNDAVTVRLTNEASSKTMPDVAERS